MANDALIDGMAGELELPSRNLCTNLVNHQFTISAQSQRQYAVQFFQHRAPVFAKHARHGIRPTLIGEVAGAQVVLLDTDVDANSLRDFVQPPALLGAKAAPCRCLRRQPVLVARLHARRVRSSTSPGWATCRTSAITSVSTRGPPAPRTLSFSSRAYACQTFSVVRTLGGSCSCSASSLTCR